MVASLTSAAAVTQVSGKYVSEPFTTTCYGDAWPDSSAVWKGTRGFRPKVCNVITTAEFKRYEVIDLIGSRWAAA
jgi:hypothetical protein